MIVPSISNSITACDLLMAAIWPSRSALIELLLGDVDGEFDHFERFTVLVDDGIVGTLNPDFLAVLADPLVFAGGVFAAIQASPEFLVLGTGPDLGFDEHAVVSVLALPPACSPGASRSFRSP